MAFATLDVGLYQVEMGQGDTIYSASTVFFSAASAHAARRTTSVGPHGEAAHEEWEGEEHASNHNISPFHHARRNSVDSSVFQRHHVSHRPHLPWSLPWIDTVSQREPFTTAISPTSGAHMESEDTAHADYDTTDLTQTQSPSNLSPHPSTIQLPFVPRLLPHSCTPQVSRRGDEGMIPDESTTSGPSTSPPHLPGHLHQIRPHELTSPSPTNMALTGQHNKQSSHFSISGMSTGERESSVHATSPIESQDLDDTARGRIAKKGKDPAVFTSSKHRSGFGKFRDLFGREGDDMKNSGDGWKEFKKGI
jgi:hypothetical protein